LALEVKIRAYASAGIVLTAYDLQKQIKDIRAEYPWIAEVGCVYLKDAVSKIDLAFKNFFRGGGFPKFKKKKQSGSFSISCNNPRKVDWDKSTLTIIKLAEIPIVLSRQFDGEIRTISISRTATGQYYASILVQTKDNPAPAPKPNHAIGIDMGLENFAILSDGTKIENPKYLKTAVERLKVLQRRASKKKKGGKNRRKAFLKVAKLHERIANQRKDFLHKVSSGLIRDNQTDTICLETLAVSNMVRNRSLAQAISDASWGEFIRQLEYKGKWYGKNIVRVGQFYASSKTCSACGDKLDDLPLSAREWTCKCGVTHDRDINAAINIRNSGMGNPIVPAEQSAMKGCDDAGILKKSANPSKEEIYKLQK
jgi:putative transposase